MGLNTNFSFEIQFLADSNRSEAQRDEVMDSLQPTLQQLLAAQDSQAEVMVSSSHRGSGSKLVELTTCLDDAQLAMLLKAFSEQHGVSVKAFE